MIEKVIIGDCELYCGNSIDILPMVGAIDSVVTDPPYGMNFQSNHRRLQHDVIANDSGLECLLWACNIDASHSKYVFCRWDNIPDVPKPKSLVTWVKNNWSMGDLEHEHARQTEVALFYRGDGHFFPSGRPADVIQSARTGNGFHPTEKPIDLMQKVIKWTDGVVVDPFMGSGTTGVACVKLGRKFIGIELERKYFDIAVKRITEAYKQPDLFIPNPERAVQHDFFVQPKQDKLIQELLI